MEEYRVLDRYPLEMALNQITTSRQDSKQFLHQIVRLIRKGCCYPVELAQQLNCLCLLYTQIVWVLKADQLLKGKVSMGTL